MTPTRASFWDRAQLRLLRLLSILVALVDGLFGIHWGEHLLERLAARWQARLAEIDASLAALEEERHLLRAQAEGLALYTAVIYLAGRMLARGELCFDPADPDDDKILAANIDLLVKEQLATVEMSEVEAGHYLYRLEPDWGEIQSRLEDAAGRAGPETAAWLRDGSKLIETLR